MSDNKKLVAVGIIALALTIIVAVVISNSPAPVEKTTTATSTEKIDDTALIEEMKAEFMLGCFDGYNLEMCDC